MERDVNVKPAVPRKAATVMLLRDGADGMEVFMIVRHQNSDVHAGALVFPGGRVEDEDYDLAADAAVFPPIADVDASAAALRVAAVRETFEECGVLLARRRGDHPAQDSHPACRDMTPQPSPAYPSPLPWYDSAVVPALVADACLSRQQLAQFADAMRALGLNVQSQRMRYDRIYARQVLSLGHGLGDPPLRALAMQLFEHFQRSPAP
jgi:8-oxo-dGTP pyrophosphatase MutT (NUDIX family)